MKDLIKSEQILEAPYKVKQENWQSYKCAIERGWRWV